MVKLGSAKFDTFAEEYHFWKETITYFGDRDEIQQEVLRCLPQPAEVVLDAGCGYGRIALALANHASYVVGLDVSESMIALARKYRDKCGKTNVDFVVGDLDNLLFKKGTFDFLAINLSLFVKDFDIAILDLSQLLKPGGRIIINHALTRNPRLDAIPIWRVFMVLKKAPKYTLAFGFKTMWRLISFEAGPVWIKYLCEHVSCGEVRTAHAFIKTYNRILPGCRFEKHRWKMAVIWDAPI